MQGPARLGGLRRKTGRLLCLKCLQPLETGLRRSPGSKKGGGRVSKEEEEEKVGLSQVLWGDFKWGRERTGPA